VQASRLERIRAMVLEAGLSGQLCVGAFPFPDGEIRSHSSERPRTGDGVAPLDALLDPGRTPARGQLIEVYGRAGSGRTALCYRLALDAIARGGWVGWVDLPDALDPRSLRRAGVRLESLLWVRPREVPAALRSAELLLRAGFPFVALDLDGASPRALARLGAAAWTRLARAVRESRATAVLLSGERRTGWLAALALCTERRRARFAGGLFEGLESHATRELRAHPEKSCTFSLRFSPR
jgi:hypothetical protein